MTRNYKLEERIKRLHKQYDEYRHSNTDKGIIEWVIERLAILELAVEDTWEESDD